MQLMISLLYRIVTTIAVVFISIGPAQAELIGHWTFDDQTAEDISGFGHNGFLSGGVLPSYSADVPGVFGGGFSLSVPGGDSHVLVPHEETLNITEALTIAAWVKTNAIGWDGIIAKSPSDGSNANHAGNYELRVENGSRNLTFLHQQGGDNDTTTYAGPAVANATWQHVAVTAQAGGMVDFYLNGQHTGSQPTSPGFGTTNSNPLYIGSRADLFTTMDGLIDDVRLYDNILSAVEIENLVGGPVDSYPRLNVLGARASSEFTNDGRLAVNAVNGAGLFGKSHSISPQGSMWLTASGDPAPEIVIDLGIVHAVDELRIWNYNENANPTCCLDRGVQTFDVFMGDRNGVFSASPVLTGATLSKASGEITDFSEIVNVGGAKGRYVKLAVTSNHGDPSFAGLSEVNINGIPVPGEAPIQDIVVTPSSELIQGFNRAAAFLLDGSGVSYGDAHSVVPDGNMWLSNGTFSEPNDLDPELVFDFGKVVTLDSMKVWNYNESLPERDDLLGRGVKQMDVYFAGDDGEFFLIQPELELSIAPGEDDVDIGEVVDLSGVPARYIKFDILSNHNGLDFTVGGDDGRANFAGLSEVQFFQRLVDSFACDFDSSGNCTIVDLNGLLYDGINDQDLAYDINNSGAVDQDDVQEWLTQAGDKNIGAPFVRGDTDLDGDVDPTDLNALGINWQSSTASSWAQGDFDGDGNVNAGDLNAVGVNWLHGTAPAAAVPEPGLGSLALLAFALTFVRLRRKSRC